MECLAEECGEIVYADVIIENKIIKKIEIRSENTSEITKQIITKIKELENKNAEEIMKKNKKEILDDLGFGNVSAGKRDFALLPIKAVQRAIEKTL